MEDTVFQQLLKPISKKLLDECVYRFQSDYDCEKFFTWDHLLDFGHFYRKSAAAYPE